MIKRWGRLDVLVNYAHWSFCLRIGRIRGFFRAGYTRVLRDQVQARNGGDIDAFMKGYEDSPDTVFIGKTVQRGYEAVRRRYHDQYPTPEKMGK